MPLPSFPGLPESTSIPPGWSNGKTRAFGAWYGGSTPPPGTRSRGRVLSRRFGTTGSHPLGCGANEGRVVPVATVETAPAGFVRQDGKDGEEQRGGHSCSRDQGHLRCRHQRQSWLTLRVGASMGKVLDRWHRTYKDGATASQDVHQRTGGRSRRPGRRALPSRVPTEIVLGTSDRRDPPLSLLVRRLACSVQAEEQDACASESYQIALE